MDYLFEFNRPLMLYELWVTTRFIPGK